MLYGMPLFRRERKVNGIGSHAVGEYFIELRNLQKVKE